MSETAATHSLQSQGQAWSASLKGCQEQQHLPSAEPRVGLVSRLERSQGQQQLTYYSAKGGLISRLERMPGIAATHRLQSRGCLLSRLDKIPDIALTHPLSSQGWAWSASLKGCQGQQQLTGCIAKGGLG